MDVKLTTRSAWIGSLALALLLGSDSMTLADEATASDSKEVSAAIFISDDGISDEETSASPAIPQSAKGSVVFIEDTPAQAPVSRATINRAVVTSNPATLAFGAKTVDAKPTTARGDLKVIANPQQSTALKTIAMEIDRPVETERPLPNQTPPVQQPTVRKMVTAELVAKPFEREQLGDIQIAVHNKSIAPAVAPAVAPAIAPAIAPEIAPEIVPEIAAPTAKTPSVVRLLIDAHQHSHEAKAVSDYSQIVQQCAEAIDLGAKGDQRSFARQLSSWALNRRGQIRLDEGELDIAKADFLAALDFHPRNWRAMHNQGVIFAQSNQFAEAFDDFNQVIQLNPKYAKAYANRATLYVQAKDLQAAIKDYEQAIERDKNLATAYVGLGRVCHMLGRWDDAIEYFTTAVQLEPTSASVICSRGDLHADMGLYGEALADYARTIELDPEFAHAYRNGAWLLATCPDERFRDPENAILGARQALECSYGEQHVALDTLAAAFASDGQFEQAIAMVTQAVDLAPEDAKFSYLTRLQLYQGSQPFRTEPVGDVSQATYEVSDQE